MVKADVEMRTGEVPYVRGLSSRELQWVVAHVEDAILKGTAQIGDYEDFVLCKQELVRRAHLRMERVEERVEARERRPWAARDL